MEELRHLVEVMAKALVDKPEVVQVTAIEGEQTTVIELAVAKEDLGKIIGKQGHNAQSLQNHSLRGCNEARKTRGTRNPRVEIPASGQTSAGPRPVGETPEFLDGVLYHLEIPIDFSRLDEIAIGPSSPLPVARRLGCREDHDWDIDPGRNPP